MTTTPQLRNRIDQLADDIGRLRRRAEPGTSLEHLADRVAGHVQAVHLLVTPSAGEIALQYAPGDPSAIDEAIQLVDARWQTLQARLGNTAT